MTATRRVRDQGLGLPQRPPRHRQIPGQHGIEAEVDQLVKAACDIGRPDRLGGGRDPWQHRALRGHQEGLGVEVACLVVQHVPQGHRAHQVFHLGVPDLPSPDLDAADLLASHRDDHGVHALLSEPDEVTQTHCDLGVDTAYWPLPEQPSPKFIAGSTKTMQVEHTSWWGGSAEPAEIVDVFLGEMIGTGREGGALGGGP